MKTWRKLQGASTSEDPCVLVAMPKMSVWLPQWAGELVFADAVGGFCNFSPEESGVRCTPSGFFFNIKNQFRIEGGFLGGLQAIFEAPIDTITGFLPPLEKAGNRFV